MRAIIPSTSLALGQPRQPLNLHVREFTEEGVGDEVGDEVGDATQHLIM